MSKLVNISLLTTFGQGVINLLMGEITQNADDISDLQEAVDSGVGELSYDANTETITFTPPSASSNNENNNQEQ